MINYVSREIIRHYFGDDFRFPVENNVKLNTALIEATTIDEYLNLLIEGYINVTIEERLEKYLMELIKGEWFHQWPLVRWAYAFRLLYNEKTSDLDINYAISILLPLAQEGYPNAMCDIAYCYCYGIGLERSYEKAVCLWIAAAKKGYERAKESLKLEYTLSRSKEIPEELRLFLVNRVIWIFTEEHNIRVEGSTIYPDKLSADATKVLNRICSEHKRLYKMVQEKAYLRHCGQLCWSYDDNPYNVGIKLK